MVWPKMLWNRMCSPWNKLSNKTNVSSTHFLAKYRFLKWGSKFCIFYKTLKIFYDFSPENHGHGGREHGVRRGFSGVSFPLRFPEGVASVLCKKNSIFGSRRSRLDHLMVLYNHLMYRNWLYSTRPSCKLAIRMEEVLLHPTIPELASTDHRISMIGWTVELTQS